jgi:glucuronosyltransferase
MMYMWSHPWMSMINCDEGGTIMNNQFSKMSKDNLDSDNGVDLGVMLGLIETAISLNAKAFNHPIMKSLLADPNTKFDVVNVSPLIASEAGYYLAYKWKAELSLYITSLSRISFMSSAMGQPHNPALSPVPVLPYTPETMTLPHRVLNTALTFAMEHIFRNWLILNKVNNFLDDVFPGEERPSLLALEKNASLAIAFSHPFIMDGWSPTVPNYVQIAMMNCRPAKGFAKGDIIGEYMDKSKNGVVFVSFGSVLQASLMSEARRKLLLNVFSRFPQYDFLWKWEIEVMEDKPSNLMLSPWLPQQDILAHPNLKAFISHTGQASFQETLCHEKPVLGISVAGDQHATAREAERMGFGIAQPLQSLTEEDLYNALDKILHVPTYAENAQKVGS